MRFVELDVVGKGHVYINPETVAAVEPYGGGQTHTRIWLSNGQDFTVAGRIDSIIAALEQIYQDVL